MLTNRHNSYALPMDITRLRLEGQELVFSGAEFDYWLPALIQVGIVKIDSYAFDVRRGRGERGLAFYLQKTISAPVGFVTFTDTLLHQSTTVTYFVHPGFLADLLIWMYKTQLEVIV